jgi:hypothetical protein
MCAMSSAPPRWAPTLAAAVATSAFALWNPPLRDLAAHTFRADYFEHYGFAIWNGSWYGGHYMLSYSVLFPPLSALLSPVWAGALAATACAWLFDGLVRARWGEQAGWAGLWFGALGAVALLANGWLVFALGAAFALAALRALQRGRPVIACACASGAALASPVAAAFLALVCVVGALYAANRGRLLATAAAALVPLALLGLLFPEGGRFPFWFSAWWPLALFCVLALVATRGLERDRDARAVLVAYLALGTLAAVAPNPLGGNMTRLGSLLGGPVLLAILLRRPARLWTPVAVAALLVGLAWQVVTPVRQTSESLGDPSTERSYYEPLEAWLGAHGAQRERIEIPHTFSHWETAYVSPRYSLARGWLRQLDLERNELFYQGRPTHERYRRWLVENAIRWVAASDARLDYSAVRENNLVREEPPYLRLRARLPHWRVYEVVGAAGMVTPLDGGSARIEALGPESFTLAVARPGRFIVRVRHTPYWDTDAEGACVGRAGDWTAVRATRPGAVPVRISFSLGAAWRAIRRADRSC